MFVVYALYSAKYDQLYIGYTADLISRFHAHNSLATSGHTVKYRPWIVAFVEVYETKQQAMKREKELKSSRGRAFIRKLISSL